MSTGKRLAKRSIIGTRVAAPGNDGKYYTGSIHALKSPASAATEIGLSITSKTRYVVRFDPVAGGRPPSPNTEYARRDLIGPGFGMVSSTTLVSGQKVYLTYNGREINAEVTEHRKQEEEVDVVFAPNGQEGTMTLTKRIDEIRLLESRKSARLADQDTDFARLADMAGDRKRTSSNTIEMPVIPPGSRKRRPSSSNDSERSAGGASPGGASSASSWAELMGLPLRCGREGCRKDENGDCMDECTAALVLMSLACSPHSPIPFTFQHYSNYWNERAGSVAAGSPGPVGDSSSDASWRSGTPSPGLSEEGAPNASTIWPTPADTNQSHNQHQYPFTFARSPSGARGTPSSPFDEGIVSDYLDDSRPQKKKKTQAWVELNIVEDRAAPVNPSTVFKCTWRGCVEIKTTCDLIEEHVRQMHLEPEKQAKLDAGEDCDMTQGEEEFYYQEVTVDHMSSPPTMSHRDMARPPHEDPEYQRKLRLEAAPLTIMSNNTNSTNSTKSTSQRKNNPNTVNLAFPTSVIRQGNRFITFGVSSSKHHRGHMKHIKLSTRALHLCQHKVGLLTLAPGKIPSQRRMRGDTKKCRKVYGMDKRDIWCTQCKWKKACTRFY